METELTLFKINTRKHKKDKFDRYAKRQDHMPTQPHKTKRHKLDKAFKREAKLMVEEGLGVI